MFNRLVLSTALLGFGLVFSGPVAAQGPDVSPTILIESLPSDHPDYRRMVLVHYLSGDRVKVSYRTYNRTEFQRLTNVSVNASDCTRGQAAKLSEIYAFNKSESQRRRSGQTPEAKSFCIKQVNSWEAKNKDKYLDPIFTGLPIAPHLR